MSDVQSPVLSSCSAAWACSQLTVALKMWWYKLKSSYQSRLKTFSLEPWFVHLLILHSWVFLHHYVLLILCILQSTANKVLLLVCRVSLLLCSVSTTEGCCFELDDCSQAWVFLIVIYSKWAWKEYGSESNFITDILWVLSGFQSTTSSL